jgi:hypothetical protein
MGHGRNSLAGLLSDRLEPQAQAWLRNGSGVTVEE